MSCRRAFEIDLAAFLASPRDARWDEFRAHYPTCPACAAEVAAWTELETRLGASTHPEPADLLRFADDPATLVGDARRRLTLHLASCRPCREELDALGRFDAPAAAEHAPTMAAEAPPRYAPAAARAATPRGATPEPPPRRSPLRAVGRVLWHPAFAWAAVMLLALTTLLERHDEVAVHAPKPQIAGRRAEDAGPPPAPRADAPADEQRAPTLAEELQAQREQARQAVDQLAKAKEALRARKLEQRLETKGDEKAAETDAEAPAARDDVAPAEPEAAPAPQTEAAAPPPPASAPRQAADERAGAGALARRAAPLGATTATAPALTVTVQPGDPTSTVYVTLPPSARGGGALEVRIAALGGERELRQRVTVASTARIAAMSVPATWLVSGRYAVTLWRDGDELGGATVDVR